MHVLIISLTALSARRGTAQVSVNEVLVAGTWLAVAFASPVHAPFVPHVFTFH